MTLKLFWVHTLGKKLKWASQCSRQSIYFGEISDLNVKSVLLTSCVSVNKSFSELHQIVINIKWKS